MLEKTTPVGKVMTPAPQHIDADLTLTDAKDRMANQGIRHLPVMRDGRLVGIVSARDLLLLEALPGIDPKNVTVDAAMTANPYTADVNTPLHEVLDTMLERHVGAVPVLRDRVLEGIFTTVDTARLLRQALV